MTRAKQPLLLTRPSASNARFVAALPDRLREQLHIVDSPLIDIVGLEGGVEHPPSDAIFTSAHGVRFAPPGAGQRAYCVGARTGRAAEDAGWRAETVGQTAAELVDALARMQPSTPLTHFCGQHRIGNVAQRLREVGLAVSEMVVYDQPERPLNCAAIEVLAGDDPVILPIFSPRTARIFSAQADPKAPIRAAAMSPAIAKELNSLNPQVLETAREPTLASMVDVVENLALKPRAG